MGDTEQQNKKEPEVLANLQTQNEEDENKSLDLITTLPIKAQRFVQLYMTGQYTLAKLAQLLDVHINTITLWMKREDVQECIRETQRVTHDMVSTQLRALTLQATAKLSELINSPIDGVAMQAVKDVLDRSGHKSKQEIKIDKTVTTVEEKMKRLIDNTIDAEYTIIEEDEDNGE